MGSTPAYAPDAAVGDGIHGLSLAWHLASEPRAYRVGGGGDNLVINTTRVGSVGGSDRGYKMIGVGAPAAGQLFGKPQA